MSIYTDPPEWEAHGGKPPSSKRREGWKPGDRVPASWLNWFWFSTVNSLREIAQAFVNHRDASAPHDGHETKAGATAKVEAHSQKTTAVHGVGQQYVAKTSRSDQWPSWNDIPDKPSTFPADAATLPQASTSQPGIVQLTNSRSSTSETLAVTAAALNAHRTSADHDGRYYQKSEVYSRAEIDSLLGSIGNARVATGQYTGNSSDRVIHVGFTPKFLILSGTHNPSYSITDPVMAVAHYGQYSYASYNLLAYGGASSTEVRLGEHHTIGAYDYPIFVEGGFLLRGNLNPYNTRPVHSHAGTYVWTAIG